MSSDALASEAPSPAQRSPGRVTIRAATVADIPALLDLGRTNHAQSRFAYMDFDDRKSENLVRRMLADPGQFAFLMAERDGRAVGYLCGQVGEALFSRALIATIMMYFVLPSARNGMAAVKLLQAFRSWAMRRNAREIDIHVTSGVYIARTDRFLRRLGFRQIGGNYVAHLDGITPAGRELAP